MSLTIQNTKDLMPTKLMGVIYAPSSFGKTTLASTLGEGTLIISCENGLLSLKKFDCDYIELDEHRRLEHLREVINFLLTTETKYKTLFIDGLAEISEVFMDEAQKRFPDPSQSFPRFGHYNQQFKKFLKKLRDLKLNVFVTCLMKEKKDDIGSVYLPDIVGRLSSEIGAMADIVLTIVIEGDENKGNIKRKLLTRPINNFICKDRSGKLDLYEPADLGHIINKIFS